MLWLASTEMTALQSALVSKPGTVTTLGTYFFNSNLHVSLFSLVLSSYIKFSI
jgi:hypothetical protein